LGPEQQAEAIRRAELIGQSVGRAEFQAVGIPREARAIDYVKNVIEPLYHFGWSLTGWYDHWRYECNLMGPAKWRLRKDRRSLEPRAEAFIRGWKDGQCDESRNTLLRSLEEDGKHLPEQIIDGA